MITTCTHCSARYRLDGEKVPRRVIRVRCPGCQGVFTLDGTVEREGSLVDDEFSGFVTGYDTGAPKQNIPEPPAPSEPAPQPEAAPEAVSEADSFAEAEPAPEPAPEPAVAPVEPVRAAPQAAQVETPAPPRRTGRRRRSKEEMLARALVSDILVYNREMRDNALADGNLPEAMSAEIKKSWELYKEKVTPEVANSTDCFRDALNEILAEGEKVF